MSCSAEALIAGVESNMVTVRGHSLKVSIFHHVGILPYVQG